jgi:DNA polymerase/3'-5' exonuclease PolX
MSTTTARIPYQEARRQAEAFRDLLSRHTKRWEIAGSVRRAARDVGDIEHVVIPITEERTVAIIPEDVVLLWDAIDELVRAGTFSKAVYPDGKYRWGQKFRGVMFNGIRHEILTCDERNWGSMLAIKTGPAEFSEYCVTRLKSRGAYRHQDGYVRSVDGTIRACLTEKEFLALCGMQWIDPVNRSTWRAGR